MSSGVISKPDETGKIRLVAKGKILNPESDLWNFHPELFLSGVIPNGIKRKLRCIPNWTPPSNFLSWGPSDKFNYMKEHHLNDTEFTVDAPWVWFGAYRRGIIPYYMNAPLVRTLYTLIIDKDIPNNKRITNSFASHYSNVNPFEYLPASDFRGHLTMHIDMRLGLVGHKAAEVIAEAKKVLAWLEELQVSDWPEDDLRAFCNAYPEGELAPAVVDKVIAMINGQKLVNENLT